MHRLLSGKALNSFVAGKTPSWLPVGTVSLTCFSFVIIIIQNVLPQRILPLCLDCGAKVPFFISQRSNLTLPPVSSCKIEEINTSLPWGWLFQRCFARFMALFTLHSLCLSLYFAFLLYFLTSPHLYSIKEPGIQPLVWYFEILVFWDTTLSSHSAGFPKLYSLPQYLVSQIHVASRVSLDLVKLSWCGAAELFDVLWLVDI